MENCSAGHRDLLAAGFAAEQISGADLTAFRTAAVRAYEAIRITQADEKLPAFFFCVKLVLKVEDAHISLG